MNFDAFLSHAFEDKIPFVSQLAEGLKTAGVDIWYDDFELRPNESLLAQLNRGLVHSRQGIVVLSEQFFAKNWPQFELEGMYALRAGRVSKNLIFIMHNIEFENILKRVPIIAAQPLLKSTDDSLAETLIREVRPDLSAKVELESHPNWFLGQTHSNPYMPSKSISRTNLELLLSRIFPDLKWEEHISLAMTCYKQLGVNNLEGLIPIFGHRFFNEVLQSMYERLLGRDGTVDGLGKALYLPALFLKGRRGVQEVEGSIRSSSEYLNRQADLIRQNMI